MTTLYPFVPHLALAILWSGLFAAAVIDALYGIIPDWANAAVGVSGILHSGLAAVPAHQLVVAAGGTFLLLLFLAEVFRRWRGRSGIGMGDIKFLSAAAMWIGLTGLPSVILIASSSALLFLLMRSLMGTAITSDTRLAFGPHLALGLAFVILFGSLH